MENSGFSESEMAFLLELEALTRKYRIAIVGCGCCGSPGIDPLQDDKLGPEYRYWRDGQCDIGWTKD